MKLVIALFALILTAGAVERALHARNLKRIKIRVLVNGTRGKTSVTRLMAAVLREAGLTTYAKCTGSLAAVILPTGEEETLARRRGVRLTEQLPFIRRAVRGDADAVVVECMAVRPESQRIMAQLASPTQVVLTNARVDHMDEIGRTEKETLSVLKLSIPRNCTVVCAEPGLSAYVENVIAPDEGPIGEAYKALFPYPVFDDNIRLVLAAASQLGIGRDIALRGMLKARCDLGMAGPFIIGDCVVVNAFAANDLESSAALLSQSEQALGMTRAPLRVVFNNRADREYRLHALLPLVLTQKQRIREIVVIGDHADKAARFFARKTGLKATVAAPHDLLRHPGTVLLMGNVKGAGAEFLAYLEQQKGDMKCSKQQSV